MVVVPFRIKVSLWLLAFLLAIPLLGPFLVPIPPLRDVTTPEALAGPESLFVEVGGLRLHVETWPPGQAPAQADASADERIGVVLLHGFGSQTRTWRHLGEALGAAAAEFAPTLAFDRPAFGLTERPARSSWGRAPSPYGPDAQVVLTLGLLDAYGVERAVLVGHSAGGSLALQVAVEHPERVAGLVLISPAVYAGGGAPNWVRPLLATPQANRIGPLIMRQFGGSAGDEFLRAAYFDPDALDPIDDAAYRRALGVEGWDAALWELVKASRERDLEPFLPNVRVPTLVLTGTADVIVPPEQSERLARALPDARYVAIERCGHVAHEECAEATVAAVLAWLGDVSTRLLD